MILAFWAAYDSLFCAAFDVNYIELN